jgi:hypothetical protein
MSGKAKLPNVKNIIKVQVILCQKKNIILKSKLKQTKVFRGHSLLTIEEGKGQPQT